MSNDYKDTLNLPCTDFPMRANLSAREPEWRTFWDENDIYEKNVARRKDVRETKPFILHDGPPYANGHIHMGTGYNKILKDIIVKYKTMSGYYAPYVPGWDCHGQPIEHQVEKNLGPERMAEISVPELRLKCRYYAEKWIDKQREEFKRLGVLGDWENPYLTFRPEYEAGNVEVFVNIQYTVSYQRNPHDPTVVDLPPEITKQFCLPESTQEMGFAQQAVERIQVIHLCRFTGQRYKPHGS